MKSIFEIVESDVDYTVGKLAVLAALGYPLVDNLANTYANAVTHDNGDQEQLLGMQIENISNQALYEYRLLPRGS